jgi:hypothetical protein
MNKKQVPFWKSKTLDEMTQGEWESLCDHCGICCIQKVEEEKTGELKLIGISCQFLDTKNCRSDKGVGPQQVIDIPYK